MNYQFVCPECGNRETIAMPIAEYKADGHFCDKCGSELRRDIKDFCTISQRNVTGFFGVEKENRKNANNK